LNVVELWDSEVIIGVDVGTSSVKVALVTGSGEIIKEVTIGLNLLTTESGAVEHNLRQVYSAVVEGIKAIVKGFEDKIEAVSFSNYLHGVALLDLSMNPLTNILTHLDTRAGVFQYKLLDVGRELYERTGCPPIFVYPLTKILWFREGKEFRDFKRITFVKDYIIYRISNIWILDYGVASGTGLMNIHSLKWDDLALSIAGIDESMLPQLIEGSRVVEYINLPELGLSKVALVPGSFDGALQNIGYSIYGENAALNLGSTAVVRVLRRDVVIDRSPEMRFFCYYAADGYRAIGAASNNGMTFLEWVRRNIASGIDWKRISEDIKNVKPCSDGVLVLPFIGGERFPYRDPYIRLTVLGVGVSHDFRHMLKASMEGVAFILKAIINALEENDVTISMLHCSGGGCSIDELIKIVSEAICKSVALYDESVARMASTLGAVAVALRALRYYSSIDTVRFEHVENRRLGVIEPELSVCKDYSSCFKRFELALSNIRSLYRALSPT
jgi:gluconokinase